MNKGVGVMRDKKMKLEDLNVSDTQGCRCYEGQEDETGGSKCLGHTGWIGVSLLFCIYYNRIKEIENQGKNCHFSTMIHSEPGEGYKMNTHHVSFR
jgi:hypothetical protein